MVEIFEGEKKVMDSNYIFENYRDTVFALDVFEKNLLGGGVRGFVLGRCNDTIEEMDELSELLEKHYSNFYLISGKPKGFDNRIDIRGYSVEK